MRCPAMLQKLSELDCELGSLAQDSLQSFEARKSQSDKLRDEDIDRQAVRSMSIQRDSAEP